MFGATIVRYEQKARNSVIDYGRGEGEGLIGHC